VVVGATGDIGQAAALQLDAMGYSLVLTHWASEPSCLADRRWVRMDVRNAASVRDVLEAETATNPPYALVYCAGIVRDGPVALLKEETWDEVLDVNLKGAFLCARSLARPMMAAGNGRIVLVGSVAGQRAQMGQAAYCASKAGLESMTRVMAREFGRYGITCNVVVPGAIESKMFRATKEAVVRGAIDATPLRRLGETRHVVAAITYLLSDDADFVTGQSIVVDGGLTIG
jgi:3-oxoacyl-[acyl-carrier protein] reductase